MYVCCINTHILYSRDCSLVPVRWACMQVPVLLTDNYLLWHDFTDHFLNARSKPDASIAHPQLRGEPRPRIRGYTFSPRRHSESIRCLTQE